MSDQAIPNAPDLDQAPHPADTAPATVGRLLPHDLTAERAVLGSMLLSGEAIDTAAATLTADDFYKPAHGHIWTAILNASADGPVDLITVADRLGPLLADVGGPATLATLPADTPSTGSCAAHAQIVARHARDRRFIHGLTEALEAAREGQIDQALTVASTTVDTRASAGARTPLIRIADDLDRWLTDLETRSEGDTPTGVLTGWHDLDRHLGGLRAGQLIVICGRPAMGKTAIAGNLAANVAAAGHTVLFVSIEMAIDELETRFMAKASRTSASRLRDATIAERDWPKIAEGVGELAELDLWINDDPTVTVPTIRAHARRVDADLVIVDYLQLMHTTGRGRNDTREREVAELSGSLKRLARELQCPVVALAQLNRNLEIRVDKKPQLSDLRESGAIENDADVVLGLYRDEYYKPESDDRGILEVITLKQRAGSTGTVRLAYLPELSSVLNLGRQEA